MRVLIADDHGIVRSGLRVLLEQQDDIEVIAEASDGAEARDMAIRERPDLAILDVKMPKLTGLQATREIREQAPDVAVLLAPEGVRRARSLLAAMDETGVVLADENLELPALRAPVIRLACREATRETGAENVALWALARAAARVGAPPIAALDDVVDRHTPAEYRAKASRAVRLGFAGE